MSYRKFTKAEYKCRQAVILESYILKQIKEHVHKTKNVQRETTTKTKEK